MLSDEVLYRIATTRPSGPVGRFRFSSPPDWVDENFEPLLTWSEKYGGGPEHRAQVLAYLRAGAVVVTGGLWTPDSVWPDRPPEPTGFRTDGMWIWSEQDIDALVRHGFVPEPSLVGHMAQRDYVCPPVPDDVIAAAQAAVAERARECN